MDHYALMSVGSKLDCSLHCKKKVGDFPHPIRDVTNQTLLGGNNLTLFPATEGLVSDIQAGDGKIAHYFLQCSVFH